MRVAILEGWLAVPMSPYHWYKFCKYCLNILNLLNFPLVMTHHSFQPQSLLFTDNTDPLVLSFAAMTDADLTIEKSFCILNNLSGFWATSRLFTNKCNLTLFYKPGDRWVRQEKTVVEFERTPARNKLVGPGTKNIKLIFLPDNYCERWLYLDSCLELLTELAPYNLHC